MTDRDVLRAAAEDVRAMARRLQAEMTQAADGGWASPDPDLLTLAVVCGRVVYRQRPEAPDLTDRLAAVLGDTWEPWQDVPARGPESPNWRLEVSGRFSRPFSEARQ